MRQNGQYFCAAFLASGLSAVSGDGIGALRTQWRVRLYRSMGVAPSGRGEKVHKSLHGVTDLSRAVFEPRVQQA